MTVSARRARAKPELRLGVLELGLGDPVRGLVGVEFRLGDGGGLEQLAFPYDVQPGFGQLGLRLADARLSHLHGVLVVGRFEPSQDLAIAHRVTLIHQHLDDLIDHLGAEADHHFRFQRARAEHLRHQRTALRMNGHHRHGPEQFEQGKGETRNDEHRRDGQFPPFGGGAGDACRRLFCLVVLIHFMSFMVASALSTRCC